MSKLSICIPVTDKLGATSKQDLENLLQSIESCWLEIHVFMDGCNFEFVSHFNELYPHVNFIWNQGKALNFTGAGNQLIKKAFSNPECQGLFLTNQDCILGDNLRLQGMINENTLISPRATDSIEKAKAPMMDGPWVKAYVLEQVEKVAFFCPLIPRAVYDKIGLMEPAFASLFGDDDYCLRAQLAGFKVLASNIDVYHRGSYVKLEKPEDRSGSGTYGLNDLGFGLQQYSYKWQTQEPHEKIISHILATRVWDNKMKIEG